jgi:nucleoid DNA-binding protein
MTYTELVKHIARTKGIKQDDVKAVLEGLNEAVIEASGNKEGKVSIAHFGNFVIKKRDARPGRNPRTGEAVTIAARKVVTFTPSKVLKEAIN